jgi:hypothetical protein
MDDTERQIGELRGEMQAGFKEMRAGFKEVHGEFKEVRAEMKDMRAEIWTELRLMRDTIDTRFDTAYSRMLWMLGTMLVVVAAILTSARL